mgnify:CR=1 FL=1
MNIQKLYPFFQKRDCYNCKKLKKYIELLSLEIDVYHIKNTGMSEELGRINDIIERQSKHIQKLENEHVTKDMRISDLSSLVDKYEHELDGKNC